MTLTGFVACVPEYDPAVSTRSGALVSRLLPDIFITYFTEMSRVRSDDISIPTATAVFLGAAILVGFPGAVLVMGLLSATLDAVGLSSTFGTGPVGLLVALGTTGLFLWLWMQISYEAAHLQLYGVEALSRGPRWAVLARHLLLSGVVLVVLAAVALLGSLWVLALASEPSQTAVAGLALAVATLGVLVRAGRAFRDGLAESRFSR